MGEGKTSIVSIGAAVQDVFLSNSDALVPVCKNPEECFTTIPLGSKVDVNNITFSTGGGASNAAVTFARQGIETYFMGVIGDDPAGEAIMQECDAEHIDSTMLKRHESLHTGYSVLLLAPGGERTILTYRGASSHFNTLDFDVSKIPLSINWLYVSTLAGDMAILHSLFKYARDHNIKVCFNPGKKELAQTDKLRALLEDVEVLILNKQEAQILFEGNTSEELVRHGHHYCNVVIISDGPQGIMATDGVNLIHAGLYDDIPVIDRTGAGDAFGSGFLSQFATGSSLAQAIIFGSANATSVISCIGAKQGILHYEHIHGMELTEGPL
jgi:sugar/nucleoside kinase (ribokinase family)